MRGNAVTCSERRFEIAAKIAHTGDAVHDEQRQHHFTGAVKSRSVVGEVRMNVHVPETWNYKHPGSIECRRSLRYLTRIFDASDSLSLNDNRLVLLELAFGYVDDRDIINGDCLRSELRRKQSPGWRPTVSIVCASVAPGVDHMGISG